MNALKERAHPVMASELESLYRQHHEMIVRTAYRVTRNMGDAEDVLHSVFVRLMQRQERLERDSNPAPYLHRAAVNAALDVLRRRRHTVSLEAVSPSREAQEPRQLRLVSSRELGDRLRVALVRLPERAAEVFVLRFVEGYTNREVGRLLGIPWGTVAVMVHRARRRLQRELENEGRAEA